MSNENSDETICKAFNQIFTTIKSLQKIENRIKNQNISALKKCKIEIESLLSKEKVLP
ncbi:MAG: hypothetical protein PHW18_10750 [Sulfuricurvum sp.]|uniref:hypothetical protein n=1 Tax=Sulfuricurvum sp. TaxID=2025608 RepID=UPI00261846EF|nr:hypothetical protein [Sulfuricurvum sp.]MDD2830042.1 hypothetical protein [Sulfuricurvum sp.]MDD4948363.1 hypothetical protein [Sulfuricurvum sp.]